MSKISFLKDIDNIEMRYKEMRFSANPANALEFVLETSQSSCTFNRLV